MTVFSSLLFLCRFSRNEFKEPLRLVGKSECFVRWVIVFSARQNCPTDSGQLVGSRNDHDIASRPGLQFTHPVPENGLFAFEAQDGSSGSVNEHPAQIRVPPFTDAQQLSLAPG